MPTPPSPINPADVRRQVDRLLANQRFNQSQALTRFLRFTVEQTLEGHGDELKESVLGIEVFSRGPDFDPRLDPIVRVQAGKLRARLKDYYDSDGAQEMLVIDFPKGGYTPVFRLRGAELLVGTESASDQKPRSKTFGLVWAAVIFAFGMGIAIGAWFLRSRPQNPPQPTRITADTGSSTFPAISRDGKFIVYASDRGGINKLDIWMQPTAGGEPVLLAKHAAVDRTPDISPDNRLVVFRSDRDGGGLYVVDVNSRSERPLTKSGWQPRFSPDGRFVVYQDDGPDGRTAIFVTPMDGGERRLLVPSGRLIVVGGPVFTPDGSRVLFTAADGDNRLDVWSIPINGGEPASIGLTERLSRQKLRLSMEAIPVDCYGDQVLFTLNVGSTMNVFRAKLSPRTWTVASPAQQITFGTTKEHLARASMSGLVVFVSETDVTRIWKLGTPLIKLTTDASLPYGNYVSPQRFSVRGRRVAFSSHRSGNADIWVRDLDTRDERAISSTPDREDQPVFSIDGTKLAWRVRRGDTYAVMVSASDGQSPRRLAEGCEILYSWSNDGTQVYCGFQYRGEVFAVDVSSGNRETILQDPSRLVKHLEFSPGGESALITARAIERDENRVFLAGFRNGRLTASNSWIAIVGSFESEAHWLADGSGFYVYFNHEGYLCLGMHRLKATGEARNTLPVKHFHGNQPAPWNRWIAVSPTDALISLTEVTANVWSLQLDPWR